ncbi:alkaline phosphatase-like protein [Microstroma glucosiphilum]|uniref:Alkaline phosphatase n=1 Tax=Pseudomicrostroma glucosiphilum TaxID=1684307 RepID=A0A316UG02_9BASI|nr:alkaline phosphatase-like protein [Pseudomicrostroma glucosiphilum]PWN23834.1 alkaline phosphatase-like protein [Pseudomicrostroma glucosiphilum]
MMISDGYGPASHTFARTFYQTLHRNSSDNPDGVPPFNWGFPLDKALVGSHRSRSSDSLITDSAAGATAFSCGLKSYNGAIGVDSAGTPCGTVFEAAKEKGYLTGVVVTSRLTDATPAAFFAHASSRALESAIAAQMLEKPYEGGERTIDLAIGGGGCWFYPSSHPESCRTDNRDLISEARQQGWDVREPPSSDKGAAEVKGPHGEQKIATSATSFNTSYDLQGQSGELPFLSLLTSSNTPYVIDVPSDSKGRAAFPTLSQLAEQAITLLADNARSKASASKKSQRKGFMLMIEGSQIDLCQHQNDPACMGREAIAYQEAAGRVMQLVDELNAKGEKTILISTSDHETGGLTLGRQIGNDYPEYLWYPERLTGVQHSGDVLSAKLLEYYRTGPGARSLRQFVVGHILGPEGGLGFGAGTSGGEITEGEISRVLECLPSSRSMVVPPIDNDDECRKAIVDVASRRANIGWTTSGHTGVDIPVFTHGGAALGEGLHGIIENTDIGKYISKLLDLDLKSISRKLNVK